MVNFFIHRPIFASSIAIIMVLAGAIALRFLPVAQLPEVTPPQVVVSATYPGVSAEVVANTVTTPLEQQINGVPGMIYMSSVSANDGSSTITVTFKVGYPVDIAAVDVQNRVASAQGELPAIVNQAGITVSKKNPSILLGVSLYSPDGSVDLVDISNYAYLQVVDPLKRLPGVGDVTIFGERRYSMRIWLDPDKLAELGITATDVQNAIAEQNVQAAAGKLGQSPAPPRTEFEYQVNALGRLSDPAQFGNIVIRAGTASEAVVHLRDVARIELGALQYTSSARMNARPAVFVAVYQTPGSNALQVDQEIRAEMARLGKRFPPGLAWQIPYDTTMFVSASMHDVMVTLAEALALVIGVVFLFLQSWRTTIIPAIATIAISVAATAASTGDKPCSSWRSTFSTTTIASSTTSPIASTMPSMVTMLSEKPIASMALHEATQALLAAARKQPELDPHQLFTTFDTSTPEYSYDLDRTKVKLLGLNLSDVFNTLQIDLGSLYVNDFNLFGRTFRVTIQAERNARANPTDLSRLYVRNAGGQMIPLDTLGGLRPTVGPEFVSHYNIYGSALINGAPAPGYSSGQAIAAMQRAAAEALPADFGYEWTGIAYQEIEAGATAAIVFALALVFVFLFLAAQYESWSMPLMVILSVPLALFGAVLALWLRGMQLDVYSEIGLVMLIGLAAKNAILIVEFAKQQREQGATIIDAAMEAGRLRLRPILMTAFAFILGSVPLMVAAGAGAGSRQSIGTTVVGGMLAATVFGLALVPVFYAVIERMREGGAAEAAQAQAHAAADD